MFRKIKGWLFVKVYLPWIAWKASLASTWRFRRYGAFRFHLPRKHPNLDLVNIYACRLSPLAKGDWKTRTFNVLELLEKAQPWRYVDRPLLVVPWSEREKLGL